MVIFKVIQWLFDNTDLFINGVMSMTHDSCLLQVNNKKKSLITSSFKFCRPKYYF